MANRKNAALIALLEHSSVAAAAEASGVSQPTIFRYLQDSDFRKKFQKAKQDMVDSALTKLQGACSRAVDVLVEIMENETVKPGIRVRAANSILSKSMDTAKIEVLELRISELERERQK